MVPVRDSTERWPPLDSELMSFDAVSDLKKDERVLFFRSEVTPSLGAPGLWSLRVHGWVFEPEEDSVSRRAALYVLRKSLGIDRDTAAAANFRRRAAAFLVDNERGKRLVIEVGESRWRLPVSGANGHFQGAITLTEDQVQSASRVLADGRSALTWEAALPDADTRRFRGGAQLSPAGGWVVVSDIDDTIRISHVLDRSELIQNTFVRPFRATSGLAELYARLAKEGAAFHYLSGSPWQLYEPLIEFLDLGGFPFGALHLRAFRVKDRSIRQFFGSSMGHKLRWLRRLATLCPRRRFLLVGDTGEQDADVYSTFSREHPGRVRAVLLRRAPGAERSEATIRGLFSGIELPLLQLFKDAADIDGDQLEAALSAD